MRFVKTFLALLLVAVPLAAQNTDNEALSFIRFSLRNPGARSLGMGGAFLGLADDASAAEANPAGLTILVKPEASLEVRHSRTYNRFATSGTYPDRVVNETFATSSEAADVSFGSVVIPIRNFAVAAYYDHPLEFTNSIDTRRFNASNGQATPVNFFLDGEGALYPSSNECAKVATCREVIVRPIESGVEVNMETIGLAGAWKHSSLSVGVAARYQTLKLIAGTRRYTFDFANRSITPSTSLALQTADGSDVTFSAGLKWSPSLRFSAGAVYKQGASIEAPGGFVSATSTAPFDPVPVFHVPDVIGAGLAVRILPRLSLNADAVRILYSNLADDFVPTVSLDPKGYSRPDVTEVHVGAEYYFATRVPFAVRAGYWRDPAHGLRYSQDTVTSSSLAEQILLRQGTDEDENHYSIGAGFAWPKFQIDAAYDTSENYKVGSIAVVTRF